MEGRASSEDFHRAWEPVVAEGRASSEDFHGAWEPMVAGSSGSQADSQSFLSSSPDFVADVEEERDLLLIVEVER